MTRGFQNLAELHLNLVPRAASMVAPRQLLLLLLLLLLPRSIPSTAASAGGGPAQIGALRVPAAALLRGVSVERS
eukprot:SAG11_NODE_24364_length_374_cov_1.120000_1_plen_74_part_10